MFSKSLLTLPKCIEHDQDKFKMIYMKLMGENEIIVYGKLALFSYSRRIRITEFSYNNDLKFPIIEIIMGFFM